MSNKMFGNEDLEASPSSQGLNLLPLLRTVKRKALLITCITAVVTALYTYIDSKKNSSLEYAGNFQILVEPLGIEGRLSAPSTLTSEKGIPNDKLLAIDYPTLVKILKSRDVLSNIVEEVKLKYPDFNVARLRENLEVARIADGQSRLDSSKIIEINYIEEDPQLVQLVLEETAQQYLDYSLTNRIQEIGTGLDFIGQQLPELNQKLTQNLNDLQALQEEYQMFQADSKSEFLLQELEENQSSQAETRKEIAEQTQIKNSLQSQLRIGVDEAIAILSFRDNQNYQDLTTKLKEKESELAVASATFNPGSPQLEALKQERQELLDLLAVETRAILAQKSLSPRASRFLVSNNQNSLVLNLVEQLVEAANNVEALQARQQNLAVTASSLGSQVRQFPEVLRRYQELQKELEIANRTRDQLLVQKDQLQVQASQTETPWKIVEEPEILRDSDGNPEPLPLDSRNSILKGLAAGLLLGVGTALLIEKRGDRFYSTEDVVDAMKSSPILGEIPYNPNLVQLATSRSFKKSPLDLAIDYLPNVGEADDRLYSDFSNAFDKLYANISLRYRDESIRSMAICSPTKGDGRSTIALNLAKQIAARGKRVLLVDENSFNYQLPNELVSVEQAEENLFVLIASQKFLHNSAQRGKLMKEFKNSYDYVIYDTPPLLDSVTAGFLCIDTDGILMVTAIGKTTRSSFKEAAKQIEDFKLPLLGIVTNNIGSSKTEKDSKDRFDGFETTKLLKSPRNADVLDAKTNSESATHATKNNSATAEKRLKNG